MTGNALASVVLLVMFVAAVFEALVGVFIMALGADGPGRWFGLVMTTIGVTAVLLFGFTIVTEMAP